MRDETLIKMFQLEGKTFWPTMAVSMPWSSQAKGGCWHLVVMIDECCFGHWTRQSLMGRAGQCQWLRSIGPISSALVSTLAPPDCTVGAMMNRFVLMLSRLNGFAD